MLCLFRGRGSCAFFGRISHLLDRWFPAAALSWFAMALMVLRSNGASSSFFFCINLLVLLWVGGKHLGSEENRPNWWFQSNVLESGFIRYSDTYGFMGQKVAESAQKCGPTVYQGWKGFLSASEVDFDAILDHYGENMPFMRYLHTCVFMVQTDLEGAQDGNLTISAAMENTLDIEKVKVGIEFERDFEGITNSGLDNHMIIFYLLVTLFYEKWKREYGWLNIIKSSNWVCFGKTRSSGSRGYAFLSYHRLLFWLMLLNLLVSAQGVTCRVCFDGIPGCAGGAACLFTTRTAENLAGLAVAGGAAISVASLLPSAYVRHLPTQILRTLQAIARVPDDDGPPDLGAMTLNELSECLNGGRIDLSLYSAELSARLADPGTAAAQVTRIQAMLLATQNKNLEAKTRFIEGINSYGVLGYLAAVASIIVNSGKRTYSVGHAASSSSSSSSTNLRIRVPQSGSEFSEFLMVWQTLCHAVGAANFLATVPFLQQVVWDSISILGLMWEQAYCVFIIYVEAIEESMGRLTLANVFAAGAQDTRMKAAKQRYSEVFCQTCDDDGDDDQNGKRKPGGKATEWNNKCSPNATGICKTYNFKDAVHPKKHLYHDGTCKFRHVCNHWVTGKGKDGVCGGDHPHYSCTNPDRTTTRPT